MLSPLNPIYWLFAYLLITITFGPISASKRANDEHHRRFSRPTSINSYLVQRRSLLRSQQSADFQSDAPALNARERLANDILMAAKRSVLEAGHADPDTFTPSRHFFDVVDTIRATPLFQIVKRMPKGGNLHGHDTAMTSIDYLVSLTHSANLWQCSDVQTERITGFRFATEQPTIDDCVWQLTADVRRRIGAETFDAFVRTHFTVRTSHPATDANVWWRSFEAIFALIGSLVTYAPVWRDYYRQVLQEALADNVQYVEFRSVLPSLYELDGTVITNRTQIVQMYVDVLAEFGAANPAFIGSKMVYAPHRDVSNATIDEYMAEVQRLQAAFPRFVAGFDLVGQEDTGRTLLSVAEWLLRLPESVRFYFHAGETNWSGSEVDENLVSCLR